MKPIGQKRWAIAEGYISGWSHSTTRELISHEALCILNAGPETAKVQLSIYFKDRKPVGPYLIEVEAFRTLHLRFNDLKDPEPIPLATDYSCVLESNVPVVVQHTRLDSRAEANALMTTMAYYEN